MLTLTMGREHDHDDHEDDDEHSRENETPQAETHAGDTAWRASRPVWLGLGGGCGLWFVVEENQEI